MQGYETLTIIISILIPMFIGFGWILNRFRHVDDRFNQIESRINLIDQRLSRMEGYNEGRDSVLKVKGE